jgi:1,4-dihydroxy-2-naphthoyl-CoA hydrolase
MSKLDNLLTNTLITNLGIEIGKISKSGSSIQGKMPVDHRTIQPAGILHGGASVAFAETLGSIAGNACINYPEQIAVGLEINANHVKSVSSGWVYGEAKAIHLGRKTHVWEVLIHNEKKQLICICRMTLAILENNKKEK